MSAAEGESRVSEGRDARVVIPFKDIVLQPGVSCVDQFRQFFSGAKMEDFIRIEQSQRVINTEDPYIADLLDNPERIDEEIESLNQYLKNGADIFMSQHKATLEDFALFLARLATFAQLSKHEPAVIFDLPRNGR